jgi:serine/threonine-protein kinase
MAQEQLQPDWLNPQLPREGRYVLGPALGQGGMGEVVEAWDVVLCRPVALKTLRRVDPAALVRFMHEAQVQARVAHPNICRIYDIQQADGVLRIAMQLVQGPTLRDAARDLSMAEAVSLVAQVAEGVHAAHFYKLIHRDIKPSNVLLETGPDGRRSPCLCDFGLAVSLAEPALTSSLAQAGTPAYMAPEQVRGDGAAISPATDVYGLGCTLHYALTGTPPGPAGPDGRRSLKPGLPRDLRAILARCLAERPGDRYPSAGDLAGDLRRFLDGEPVLARPAANGIRLLRRVRRHLWPAAFAATLCAALAAAWIHLGEDRFRAAAGEAARHYAQERLEWEQELAVHRTRPVHDLAQVQAAGAALVSRILDQLQFLDPAWRGPAHAAIGRIHGQLGDFARAGQELELALRQGPRDADTAQALALARVLAACWGEANLMAPPPANLGRQLTRLLPPAAIRDRAGPAPLYPVLAALAKGDYAGAAAAARPYLSSYGWRREAVLLGSACQTMLASQELAGGHPDRAEPFLQQALECLETYMRPDGGGTSDLAANHAWLLTARRLAALRLQRGRLSADGLQALLQRSDQILTLDPDRPSLQTDWLGVRALRARQLREQGREAYPPLDAAMVFLQTRAREPMGPDLRIIRMNLFFQLAEQLFEAHQDPDPALGEALKEVDESLPVTFGLFSLLNLQARVEAARGHDPRAVLERNLASLEPLLAAGPRWPLCAMAAEAWLVRASWEQGRGLDCQPSLDRIRDLVGRILAANPDDPDGRALQGLARVVELRAHPENRAPLLAAARDDLRRTLDGNSGGRLARELQERLKGLS